MTQLSLLQQPFALFKTTVLQIAMAQVYAEFSAVLDDSQAVVCGRGPNCPNPNIRPKQPRFYVANKVPGRPGRIVCRPCFDDIVERETTEIRGDSGKFGPREKILELNFVQLLRWHRRRHRIQ